MSACARRLAVLLRGLVEDGGGEVREHGARLLGARGEAGLAEALTGEAAPVLARLSRSGCCAIPN